MSKLVIKSIQVENFKSLVDFDLPLAKLSCLVGLNGAGKSTVLQFFDFLSQQVRGDLDNWLKNRRWRASDLNSKLTRKQNIIFDINLSCNNGVEVRWVGHFNRSTLRCTTEVVLWNKELILEVTQDQYRISAPNNPEQKKRVLSKIAFDYQGSVLSQIRESQLPEELIELKNFFIDLHALDLLSPELLRQRTRDANNSLGLGGEKLSAFLHAIGESKRDDIQAKLSKIYPQLKHLDLSSLRSGWKTLAVQEHFADTIIKTEARHVADGFLRMLAVFTQLSKEQSFLLLDEIENGINPELIEFLIDELVGANPQVLITTHSPMVLNYLEDEVALKGVIYVYKNHRGATQAKRLFDIPAMREKLSVMGPGEVYEDTLLTQLNQELTGSL